MTRQPAPVRPPVVLTIAGSDSGGGAGIQADLKTIEAGGAFGTSAITSVTAQNTRGVERSHGLPVEEIEAQIEAVRDDFDVAAVKTGMLGTRAVVETVVDYADDLSNLVVDPVMVAASGDRLLEPEAEAAYEGLVAQAVLVTPNADEAAVLTDVEVTDVDAAREAGERLVGMGADAALVKGGHVPGVDVVDVLVTGDSTRTFRHDRVDTDATHGSGCTLSSAIATRLAHGDDLASAVDEGVTLLASAVRYGVDVGSGPGSVHHLVEVRNEAARGDTVEAVEHVARSLVETDATALVPPGGTTVAGATPYAESPRDVAGADCSEGPSPERAGSYVPREQEGAGVDGDIGHAVDGLRPNRCARFGAAGRLGNLVLAVREASPTVRFAVACRRSDAVDRALSELSGPVVELSSNDGGDDHLGRRVAGALDSVTDSPTALVDETHRAGRVTLLAPDADALVERVRTLPTGVGE